MKTLLVTAALTVIVGCGQIGRSSRRQLAKCDRLEIWKAVLVSSTYAREVSTVIQCETGRDEYSQIYIERLEPTLKRFGIDRLEALNIFEEEGGWPYQTPPRPACAK